MTDSSIEQFEKLIKSSSLSDNDIPHLTDIANDLRIIKSDDITKIIIDRLTMLKTDNLIITIFKLIDSILCNVTTPYNEKFSEPLSSLFKKKYLVLNNANRQILITIFESWVEKSNQKVTKSNDTDDMFEEASENSEFLSKSTLKNIETFLIKASLLHEKRFLEKKEKEGFISNGMKPGNTSTPSVKDLLQITERIIRFMNETLNKQFNDELQQRLYFIQKVHDLLMTKKFENESEIIEIFNKMKELPEYSQALSQSKETDERVSNFIEKSKAAKINEIRGLLDDFKSLNHEDKQETKDSFLTDKWSAEKYQAAVKQYHQKNIENQFSNAQSEEQTLEKSSKKLPDLTLLTNISKDVQATKLKISEFMKIDIKNENLGNWSKYIQLMYRHIPEKCFICGKRFPLTKQQSSSTNTMNANKRTFMLLNASNNDDDNAMVQNDDSKKMIEQHMDWHYETINKSQIMTKTGVRKMMVNRTWFGNNSYLSALKQDEIAVLEDEGEKRRKYESEDMKYVVVPQVLLGQMNDIECAICRDVIKVSYVESIGEWCMIDCKETSQGYVHLSCLH